MEFSVVTIPRALLGRGNAIVEAGDGRLGLLTIEDGMLNLYCKSWQRQRCWCRKTTPLPDPDSLSLRYKFIGSGAGCLLLQAIPQDPSELPNSSQGVPKVQYFTLEVKTLLLEKLCVSDKRIDFALLYANFPLLSLPTV
jgi:hypothetical protein